MRNISNNQKKELNDMINKNQDWFFPILSGISVWWVGVWLELLKNPVTEKCYESFILYWTIFFLLSLMFVLINLFMTIYFATKMQEWVKLWWKKNLIDFIIQATFIASFLLTLSWISIFLIYLLSKHV